MVSSGLHLHPRPLVIAAGLPLPLFLLILVPVLVLFPVLVLVFVLLFCLPILGLRASHKKISSDRPSRPIDLESGGIKSQR